MGPGDRRRGGRYWARCGHAGSSSSVLRAGHRPRTRYLPGSSSRSWSARRCRTVPVQSSRARALSSHCRLLHDDATALRIGGTNALIFWGLGAVVGRPVFGLAGSVWRTGEHRYRALALGLLAATLFAEGGYHLLVLPSQLAVGFAIAGLLVPLLLGRSREDRGVVAAVPALALGRSGFAVFLWIYDMTSRSRA